ncbi:hypothetical protein NMK71_10760 [Weeksellaceae bacterium KMM 9713]|uniref:Uncharacterized protein n=1 Tax=Profundicola chukchiensis TaxID=2961959 RepID=A0A9X4MXV7_9FLAO|nr:hypothetical protein [Profundicola chukchiensis]MDG4946898.1 hypothetical protein [Profundicola chukchiensis]
MKENLHKAATLTSTFYTILDMANIDYDNAKNEKIHSLSSDEYLEPKERYILNSDREIIKIKD